MAPGRGKRRIAGMSGAQAAAGDLLRARATATEAEEEVDEALIAAASGVFSAFETFYKARRTYSESHPALERFHKQLEDKLKIALGEHGELAVSVTPTSLELGGKPVFSVERPDLNMWFPLYRDGIREISLSDGIDRDEIARFSGAIAKIAAIKPGEEDDDGEDDAVTALWDLALEHIGYVAIDTFVDSSAPDDATRDRVAKIREMVTLSMMKELAVPAGSESFASRDLEMARRMKSVALTKADLVVLARENLAALDELPMRAADASRSLYAIDDHERRNLATGVTTDPDATEKLLEAIIHALLSDGGSDNAEPLCARIERAFTTLVVDGRFDRATRLRRTVIAAAGSAPDPELFGLIDRAMAAPSAMAAIGEALAKRDDASVREVLDLVEVLPAVAAGPLLASLENVEQRTRRRAVCDALAGFGARAIEGVTAALPACSEDVALDLLYLLKRIGTDVALAALEQACSHTAPVIRAGAVRLHAEVAPASVLATRLRIALRDPDALVRAAALEATVARRPQGALQWIKDAIAADGFSDLELGEKKRLFAGYATLGGEEAAADLLARLGKRNLLQRGSVDDERAAAAAALGQARYEPARETLERLAGAKLLRQTVRIACADAIADLDREQLAPEPAAVVHDAAPIDAPPPPSQFVKFRNTSRIAPLTRPPDDPAVSRPPVAAEPAAAPRGTGAIPPASTARHAGAPPVHDTVPMEPARGSGSVAPQRSAPARHAGPIPASVTQQRTEVLPATKPPVQQTEVLPATKPPPSSGYSQVLRTTKPPSSPLPTQRTEAMPATKPPSATQRTEVMPAAPRTGPLPATPRTGPLPATPVAPRKDTRSASGVRSDDEGVAVPRRRIGAPIAAGPKPPAKPGDPKDDGE